jgi:hypothetical protein
MVAHGPLAAVVGALPKARLRGQLHLLELEWIVLRDCAPEREEEEEEEEERERRERRARERQWG